MSLPDVDDQELDLILVEGMDLLQPTG